MFIVIGYSYTALATHRKCKIALPRVPSCSFVENSNELKWCHVLKTLLDAKKLHSYSILKCMKQMFLQLSACFLVFLEYLTSCFFSAISEFFFIFVILTSHRNKLEIFLHGNFDSLPSCKIRLLPVDYFKIRLKKV